MKLRLYLTLELTSVYYTCINSVLLHIIAVTLNSQSMLQDKIKIKKIKHRSQIVHFILNRIVTVLSKNGEFYLCW